MPREGQTSVTIATYSWEETKKYFATHKKELKKKGIHSPSRLVQMWVDEHTSQG